MKSFYTSSNEHKLNIFFVFLIFVFAWVVTHPYSGIWHDGWLYLAQALLKIDPSIYKNDIFFKFGSQDSYSIFSEFYVFFIKFLGVELAALILVLFFQFFFIATLWLVCKEIYGRLIGVWSICGVAILSAYYGSDKIFSYAETFFTARNVAEPLCLLAIYFLLRRRPWISAGMLIMAGAFHPLIAFPVLFIWWIFQSLEDKRFFYLILLLPIVILLALSDVQPFHRLLEVYDSAWWDVVLVRNKNVLPLNWPLINWILLGIDCCCIYLAIRVLQGKAQRLMISTLLATFKLTAISILGTSVLKNVLLTSLQLWRIGWVLHFLAMASVPYFIIILWRKGGLAAYSALFLTLSGFLYPDWSSFTFIIFSILLYFLHRRGVTYDGVNQRLRIYLNFGVGIILLCIVVKAISDVYVMTSIPALFEATDREKIELTFFSPYIWKLELVIAWGLFFIFNRKKQAFVFLLVCLIPVLYLWDQRSPWQKYVTAEQAKTHPFRQYINEHREVYWHNGNVLSSWTLLGATSYYSRIQGAGALFNRGTAIELYNRAKLLGQNLPECGSGKYSNEEFQSKCVPNQTTVRKVCSNEPRLDAMIFSFEIKGLHAVRWTFEQPDPTQNKAYFLYPCSIFRKS